ncbi:hypothetical protein M1O18_00500 [Dehalococcoidia bacterium]|nr:hypothetical protein [Dehalococcoidia bacterium]
MIRNEPRSELIGKIILADLLEYPLEKFTDFIQKVEQLPLYKKLSREGIITRRYLVAIFQMQKHLERKASLLGRLLRSRMTAVYRSTIATPGCPLNISLMTRGYKGLLLAEG